MSFRQVTRIAVDVTFLRLEPGPAIVWTLPEGCRLEMLEAPSVAQYRTLYNGVGQAHCWWLRRMMPDADLAAVLADPGVSIHVLYRDAEPAGFFELDRRGVHDVNLGYFGLLPHAIGAGLGRAMLAAAIAEARARSGTGVVRVNTCTADHPRALPTYKRAGFVPVRTVREVWEIPTRLGLTIPDHLRI